MKNSIYIVVLIILSFSKFGYSHAGHDEIPFVELSRIMNDLVRDIELFNSTPIDLLNTSSDSDTYTYIHRDGRSIQIPQSALSKVFAYQLALHKESLDFHCSGGCHEQKRMSQIYLSRLYRKVKKKKTLTYGELKKASVAIVKESAIGAKKVVVYPFKVAYEWGTEEVPELLWKSVGKVRSLGVPFVLINAIGEALDVVFIHSLHIPIPFCTVINTASFWISERVKSFSKLAFKKQDGKLNIVRKWKTLSNFKEFRKTTLKMRKQLIRYLFPAKRDITKKKGFFKKSGAKFLNSMDQHRKNYWVKNKERVLVDFIDFTSSNINLAQDFEHLKDLSTKRKLANEVFYDQFETLQNWMDIQTDFFLEMYHEKDLNFREHMKVQWRLGAVENKLHDYKAHVLNLINDPLKLSLNSQEIESAREMYQNVLKTMIESSRWNCNRSFLDK